MYTVNQLTAVVCKYCAVLSLLPFSSRPSFSVIFSVMLQLGSYNLLSQKGTLFPIGDTRRNYQAGMKEGWKVITNPAFSIVLHLSESLQQAAVGSGSSSLQHPQSLRPSGSLNSGYRAPSSMRSFPLSLVSPALHFSSLLQFVLYGLPPLFSLYFQLQKSYH